MKTFEECKQQAVVDWGYTEWDELVNYTGEPWAYKIAAKLYAEEAVREDREKIIRNNPVKEWKIPGYHGVQVDEDKIRILPLPDLK